MEQSGYPKLKDHVAAHQKLGLEFDKLTSDFRKDMIDSFVLVKFISRELILGHLVTDDKDFFHWLDEC